MEILINRQSVSMGDDVDDHIISYTVNELTKFSDVFTELIATKYFPNVFGNNVVWTMFWGEEDLISWNTKEDKLYSRFVECEPTIISMRVPVSCNIHFRYYSSPIKRAEYIFRKFNGSKFQMWHEGFMNEYDTYSISQDIEKEWIKTIKTKCE